MLRARDIRVAVAAITLYSAMLLSSCGGVSTSSSNASPTSSATGAASPGPQAPAQQGIVVLVMEENHGYEDTIGNSAMPYFNRLAQQGALATQYYADAHPSIGNYLMLTTGAMGTLDDSFSGTISDDNLAREISAAGKSWKAYEEDIPSAGYLGPDSGNYLKHHNPFAYFSDVIGNSAQAARMVPFTQFSADMNAGALPSFSFVVPNKIHDAHDCPTAGCTDAELLGQADQWLQSNIGPLLTSAQFQNNGLLLIVFDEATLIDIRHGGGHVALVAVGPRARAGAQSATIYQHENTLRTICSLLGLGTCPGASASVSAESDLLH